MANPGLGAFACLGFGEELTYGTPADRNKFVEFDSESIKAIENQIESPSIFSLGRRTSRSVQGGVAVAGDVVFSPQFEGWYKLLKHLLGSVTTTHEDPSNAPDVWKHTFVPANYLPTGLTIEIQKDPTTVSGGTFLTTGAKVEAMSLAVSARSQIQVTMSVVGRQMENSLVPTTPNFSSTKLIPGTIGAVQWGGGSLDVSELKLDMKNNLNADRRFLGSRFIKEPVRAGKFEVMGTFKTEFQSLNQYNDFRNDTRRELVFDFVGDVISGTAYNYRLKITLPITRLNDANPVVAASGLIPLDIAFDCYRDDSNPEVKFEVWNTEDTI